MTPARLTRRIHAEARRLGFDAVGCAPVEPVPADNLDEWLERGYQGEMGYMGRNREKRLDPDLILEGARSVLAVALNYRHDYSLPYKDPGKAVISRYASGDDYHDVLWKRLDRLLRFIRETAPGSDGRFYVDTGPVLEKTWAARSGLGWLGKHGNLLSRQAGSWFFLGEIILNVELEYDEPVPDHCGSCTRCIEACPTQAIREPYVVDSRRCISYLTIELRGDIPEEHRENMGNLVYGCDICQDVCPWNSKAPLSQVEELAPRPSNRAPELRELAGLSQAGFSRTFAKSAVKRTKRRGLLRNVAVAMGNSMDPGMLPDLERLAEEDDPLIQRRAKWSIDKIRDADAESAN